MALDFPDTPQDGDTFGEFTYDATRQAWRTVRSGARIVASATAPTSPINGDMWLYTEDGAVFTYLDGAWIEVGNSAAVLSDADNARITSVENFKDQFEIYDPADGDVLSYNATSGLLENTQLNITSSLAELTDTNIVSPSAGGGLVYNGSQWVQNSSVSNNLIINGTFLVNQKRILSETPVIATGNMIDRWKLRSGNSVNHNVSVLKNQLVPELGPVNVLKISNFYDSAWLGQYVEIATNNFISQQEVTVSFYAKADTNISDLRVFFHASNDDGDHGSPYFTQTGIVTTSWQRYSYSMTMGTLLNNSPNGAVNLGFGQQSTDTAFYITGVQLELGSFPTPFKHRLYQEELALCQRYYQKSGNDLENYWVPSDSVGNGSDSILFTAFPNDTNRASPQVDFKVIMRAAPTMTYYNARPELSNPSGQINTYNGPTVVTYSAPAGGSVSGINGYFTGLSLSNATYTLQYEADAEF